MKIIIREIVIVIIVGLGKFSEFVHETHGSASSEICYNFGCALCLMLGINALAKDGRADPDHVGATGDGGLVIGAHAHRQKIHIYIIVFFLANVNKKLLHPDKIWLNFLRRSAFGRNCHESPDPDRSQSAHFRKGTGERVRGKAGF